LRSGLILSEFSQDLSDFLHLSEMEYVSTARCVPWNMRESPRRRLSHGGFQCVLPELVRKLFDNTLVECVRESQYLRVNIIEG
jgi:hypothetical protein